MRFIKRLEKIESKLADRHRETCEDQQISGLDQLAAEIWKIKAKAERDGDGRLALACVRELEQIDSRLAGRNGRTQAGNAHNLELDNGTAALMAQTFLQRLPSNLPRAECVPEEGQECKDSPGEQPSAQAGDNVSQQGEDGPSIRPTNTQPAGRQLPSGWLSSKW